MRKTLYALLVACLLVASSSASAFATWMGRHEAPENWNGGPPVIADPSAHRYEPGQNHPLGYIVVRGQRYDIGSDANVNVIAGEYVTGSCEWHINPEDIGTFDRTVYDPHESYCWWQQEQQTRTYLDSWCVFSDDSGWQTNVQFLEPGEPCLRFDYRYTSYEDPDNLWSVREPSFAPHITVYKYSGVNPKPAAPGSRVLLNRVWTKATGKYNEKTMDYDADGYEANKLFPVLSQEVVLTSATNPDGTPFTEEDRIAAENTFSRRLLISSYETTFRPEKPGIYQWEFRIKDHPEVPPATIIAKVVDPKMPSVHVKPNHLFTERTYNGKTYIVQKYGTGGNIGINDPYNEFPLSDLINIDPSWTATINNPDGTVYDPDQDSLVTGSTITVASEYGSETAEIIIATDLLGRGGHGGMPNVIRTAQALNGSAPLEPPLLWAVDFNNNGKVDAADLVKVVQLIFFSE